MGGGMIQMEHYNLILGNGFNLALIECAKKKSIDLNLKIDYAQILERVKESINSDKNLIDFIEKSQIKNIEKLLWILKYSAWCFPYEKNVYVTLNTGLNEDIFTKNFIFLKEKFISAITSEDGHPTWSEIFKKTELKSNLTTCSNNLNLFNRIFTINYDLLLYWLLNYAAQSDPTILKKFKDCFSNAAETSDKYSLLEFRETNNKESLLYLHGALHLLRKENKTFKISKNGTLNLLGLRKILTEKTEFENLLILEPTSDDKEAAIGLNPYLTLCHKKLLTCTGTIIVYGCSIFDTQGNLNNDKHLWENVASSKASKIYLGIHSQIDERIRNNIQTQFKAKNKNEADKQIFFFQTEKTNIWDSNDFISDIETQSFD